MLMLSLAGPYCCVIEKILQQGDNENYNGHDATTTLALYNQVIVQPGVSVYFYVRKHQGSGKATDHVQSWGA